MSAQRDSAVERANACYRKACRSKICPFCKGRIRTMAFARACEVWPELRELGDSKAWAGAGIKPDATFYYCDGPGRAPAWTKTPDSNPWHFAFAGRLP